jgi:single-strand DNA-binding protein
MNVFCFAGNICKDIELRSTNTGKKVASFSVAINEGKDKTEFVNVVAWEKTAELLEQYCKKGDRLSGTARVQTRSYDDGAGNKKYVTEFVLTQFDFPPKSGQSQHNIDKSNGYQAQSGFVEDDEIPF